MVGEKYHAALDAGSKFAQNALTKGGAERLRARLTIPRFIIAARAECD